MTRTGAGKVSRWVEKRLAEVESTKRSSRDLKRLSLRIESEALEQLEGLALVVDLPVATLASKLLLEALAEATEKVKGRVDGSLKPMSNVTNQVQTKPLENVQASDR